MPVLIEKSPRSHGRATHSYEPLRATLASRLLLGSLSGGNAAIYEQQLAAPRQVPASMTQPVAFYGEDDETLGAVRLQPVDESEDYW